MQLEAKVECSQLLPHDQKTKGIGDDRALVKFGGVVLEKKFHAGTPGAQFSCGVGVTEPSAPEPYTPKFFGFCLL